MISGGCLAIRNREKTGHLIGLQAYAGEIQFQICRES